MMKCNQFTLIATALIFVGITACPLPTWAETASQVTKSSYAPKVTRAAQGGVILPATSNLKVPEGADTIFVTPSGLQIEGDTLPALRATVARIESSIKGQRVSGRALFEAAQALEDAYIRAGYLLARVALPPQTIEDGKVLTLIVTLGYVERIDASAFSGTTRSRIEAILTPLVGNHALTKAELERRLLFAGDIPGVLLHSTLKAGETPGATIIVVDGRDIPVLLSTQINNERSDELGNYSASINANFNNLLGLGEVGYLQVGGYPGDHKSIFDDEPRNRQLVAGITVPLSLDGWWMNVEAVDSKTNPTSKLDFPLRDEYQRIATKLGYNWIRSRNFNTSSEISLDISSETQKFVVNQSEVEWTKDSLRVLRLSQNADLYTSTEQYLTGNITASFGIDGLGARQGSDTLPMSRSGAKPDFRKLAISSRYSQGFMLDRLQWSVLGKAQTAFGNAMPATEQFDLGGAGGLSGFDSGELVGDSGIMIRTELSFSITLPPVDTFPSLGSAIAPYVFGALGSVAIEEATAVERSTIYANALGLGLRFGVSQRDTPSQTTLALEYGHGEQNSGPSDDRFSIRWTTQF
ncbi:ShlB/FhaC/HecB family hemolysin secretion/activation protein [Vibrio gazogenes]|uniref:Hemolysin activation/secretion protein n=1 Tax=Vibrio gazogenes DSM 21264 = NBRC 103151 TaxID=1123492 RepID=A0A1M5H289_VIBGA|nr:ShlB/FhaC/HecB family hemolysin secretion/activation protein [Vibrio gazogenes]USP14926.1 ShlB/FhaC/HecB family hemolysin secretion/activation protein [Vibrio gazogenes]SHG10070.1 Hemolysin activation/secretion protein [Vibrio gazogenes DSM 21264] [Vibrio gazogenes DSM 21264 = NBRC 103151]SJN53543.1 Heme/hemopexin transporter protein HuxB precursor [Vibrio gazogenes]